MKQTSPASSCALVLLAATALSATPLVGQEAVTAPPVVATVPPPAEQPAPASATPPAIVFAPRQEVVQQLPVRPSPVATPEAAPEQARTIPRAERRAPVASTVATAPVRSQVSAPDLDGPSAVAAAPLPVPQPPVATETLPPSAPVPAETPVVETTATTGTSMWTWVVGAAVILLAALGLLFSRRRRPTGYAEEPVYGAVPVAGVQPVVVPVAEAIATPAGVPATETFAERPWIRMTLEPTATEPRGSDMIMTYQLIVENEGPVDAHDVQISSFLFRDRESSPMEQLLIDPRALRGRVDVPAGRSVRVEASVVVPGSEEARIVADARYPLPDGGEGHLAARFAVDTASAEMETRVDDVLDRV
ncbi:LPXTG cell wall anchor domain-containing protein [Sphingomonas sp. SUN039]|uniref:LPXTG cell wall anchor domain-containing protein n=1 Tax=Sphingomonas sp. SUN039 TaxID=2937787 RepID=UPI002164CF2F|nr:LPXTG cell wall anchor domain-containing protein [Sphingomonas sp. SUN039]UVO54233.1 LPXTG cell wall anchor domain-containing protein [Sphingomonas sp. SUN039]